MYIYIYREREIHTYTHITYIYIYREREIYKQLAPRPTRTLRSGAPRHLSVSFISIIVAFTSSAFKHLSVLCISTLVIKLISINYIYRLHLSVILLVTLISYIYQLLNLLVSLL